MKGVRTQKCSVTYHFERVGLYEHRFGKRAVRWVGDVHALPRERLQNVPVVQTMVVGVGVHVRERQAVQLGIREAPNYGRFKVFLVLEKMKQLVRSKNKDCLICDV